MSPCRAAAPARRGRADGRRCAPARGTLYIAECGMRNAEWMTDCGLRIAELVASTIAGMRRIVIAIAVVAATAAVAAQPGRGSVAVVGSGGTVITENASHQVVDPGAVAIDGTDIIDVGSPEALAAKYQP